MELSTTRLNDGAIEYYCMGVGHWSTSAASTAVFSGTGGDTGNAAWGDVTCDSEALTSHDEPGDEGGKVCKCCGREAINANMGLVTADTMYSRRC